jgi:predicted DNA-binding protein YlxM (UPF0122 family)
MIKKALYNTHYEAYAEMLGKPNVHSVFEHILDAYSSNRRTGKLSVLSLSMNEIARKRHVSKNTVPEIIKILESTKIIRCDKEEKERYGAIRCSIDIDRFVSLIYAFIVLDQENKKKFTTALLNGDEKTIESLGYYLIKDAAKKDLELKGDFDFLSGVAFENLPKISQDNKTLPNIGTDDSQYRDSTFPKEGHLPNIGTDENTTIDKYVQKCTINPIYQTKMYDKIFCVQKCTINELYQEEIRAKMYNKTEIRAKMYDKNEIKALITSTILRDFPEIPLETVENDISNFVDGGDVQNLELLPLFFAIQSNYVVYGCLKYVQKCEQDSAAYEKNEKPAFSEDNRNISLEEGSPERNEECKENGAKIRNERKQRNERSERKEERKEPKERSKEREERKENKERKESGVLLRKEPKPFFSKKKQNFKYNGASPAGEYEKKIFESDGLHEEENSQDEKKFDSDENPQEQNSQVKNYMQEDESQQKHHTANDSAYEIAKLRKRLPYFTAEEIERIISDLPYCLDRPDKIFINRVWDILSDYSISEEEDEDGKITEVQFSPEKMPYPVNRMFLDIISNALNETEDMIRNGKVEVKGTMLPVTTKEMLKENDFEYIIDFEKETLNGESYYIVSKKNFRNIFEEPILEIKTKRLSREENHAARLVDKGYMRQILIRGKDDKRFQELTPIELSAYHFLIEYFEIDENNNVIAHKQDFINRVKLPAFTIPHIFNKGLTPEDFFSIMFKGGPERGTGALNLTPRMFSAEKIKRWNDLHVCKSTINLQEVQESIQEGKVY